MSLAQLIKPHFDKDLPVRQGSLSGVNQAFAEFLPGPWLCSLK